MRDPAPTLLDLGAALRDQLAPLRFGHPVTHVYNPLDHAWELHRAYLERFGGGTGRVVLLGMNPGPWGMAQTGVPFGEISAVRDWMGLQGQVRQPSDPHPKRPIQGLSCTRSEVSGRRLWGWAQERFGSAERFFKDFFVLNYCPLSFMEASGRNRTPNKLPASERDPLFTLCDASLRAKVQALRPRMLIGVGAFAEQRAKQVVGDLQVPIGRVLHPSPASPAANKGWAEAAEKQLQELGALA
ncbi:MAG: single-strand selective monofunctional uracil-DNA glycosylase [Deltaproteobacteria bacterium]|nr:MAG: single-strand selective monofunctional uracil-DNA glycosylase [Deltaproteobacteria bacterium]